MAVGDGHLDAGEPLPRRWLIFAIVGVALLMISIDQTIVATALQAIQHDLGAELTWSGWTLTVYSVGQIIVMPLAGRFSERFGRKRVFLLAVGVFTAASLCCGFATDIYTLVALRAVQALGGGAFVPSASGIVADYFGRDRDRAVGMFISIFPIGGMLGPVLGGLFVTYSSWRTIFLVNVPAGLLLLALGARFIATERRQAGGRIDPLGIVLLAGTLLCAMYSLTNLGSGAGFLTDPLFLVPAGSALLGAASLVRHTLRHRAPFIPATLLFGRGFGAMNVINLLVGGAVLGFGVMIPLYAQLRFHLDPLASGTLLTARAVGTICVGALAVLVLRRLGHRVPIVVGFLVTVFGMVLIALPPPGRMSAYAWLALGTGITGLGQGVAIPASNNAVLQLAPDQLTSIAGLRGMFRQTGSIIAISVSTAILAASAHPAMTQSHTFLVFAALLLAAIPLVYTVPDHRGRW